MADSLPEKSRGMKFAEQQLARYGWAEGKGLGRDEDGISEAIRVKVKCNKEGIGHKKAEEFTFHWWDHVFNKASSSLQVESGQNGVEVKTTVETEGSVSNKKPRKAALSKDKMYGCFVKAGTLLSGEAPPEPQSSDSSSSSSSEDDDRMDLSSMTRLSDADLMKACGGRTAHKGARHGFGMSAKLARLEKQEAEYMAKYGKKNQLPENQQEKSPPVDQSTAKSQEEISEVPQKKKKKNKNKNKKGDLERDDSPAQVEISEVPQKKKKNKNKNKKGDLERDDSPPQEEISEVPQEKKKKKKKKKGDLEEKDSSPQKEIIEGPQEEKKKQKKGNLEEEAHSSPQEERRRRKRGEEELELMEAAVKTPECSLEEQPVKKKKRKSCRGEKETEEECPPKPKTKKKRRKEKEEETNMDEEERSVEEDQTQEEAQAAAHPKRKKKEKEETIIEEEQTKEEAQAAAHPKRKKKETIIEEEQTQEEAQAAAPPRKKRSKESRE